MKKIFAIILSFAATVLLISSCEEENCPPNSLAYAVFALSDQYGNSLQFTSPVSVIGQIQADVTVNDTLEDGTIQEIIKADSIINDTIINQESASEYFQLPLSYDNYTRFIIAYDETNFDTITINHQNIPYFTNLDCGTMMFYNVTDVTYTRHVLDSLTTTNPNIDNNEKENFKIYYTNFAVDE